MVMAIHCQDYQTDYQTTTGILAAGLFTISLQLYHNYSTKAVIFTTTSLAGQRLCCQSLAT